VPDFRRVTDDLSVAPQITIADVAEAARQGFQTLISNRPDGEDAGQPTAREIAAAAAEAGVSFYHIPVRGGPTPEQVEATRQLLGDVETPVLAFCRSGTRSIVTWSLARAAAGDDRAELAALGRAAGYDLSGVLGA